MRNHKAARDNRCETVASVALRIGATSRPNGLRRLPNAALASSKDGSLRCGSAGLSIRSPVRRSLDYRLLAPVEQRNRIMNQQPTQPGLFIGIDWADQKHDVYVIDLVMGKAFPQAARALSREH